MIDLWIDFNGVSNRLELSYAKRESRSLYFYIYIFV